LLEIENKNFMISLQKIFQNYNFFHQNLYLKTIVVSPFAVVPLGGTANLSRFIDIKNNLINSKTDRLKIEICIALFSLVYRLFSN
jgi:hypothetical protein